MISFLSIATDKNFSARSEDRLTQIVMASFTHSSSFRKIFMEFLGIKIRSDGLRMETRLSTEDNKRPDISIFNQAKRIAIVECKTKSNLAKRQLQQYHNLANKRYILTMYPESEDLIPQKGWQRRQWGELLYAISKRKPSAPVDKWILNQLENYLRKDIGIMEMSSINNRDLKSIHDLLQSIRYEDKIEIRDAGENILKTGVLQNIILEGFRITCADNAITQKYFGKKPRPNASFSWGYYESDMNSGLRNGFGFGINDLLLVGNKKGYSLSIGLVVRPKKHRDMLCARLWKKQPGKSEWDLIWEYPFKVGKVFGARDLALQLTKKVLPQIRKQN